MPHFNDEPCPCGSRQRTAELAAELLKLKRRLDENDVLAVVTHEIAVVLAMRLGMSRADLKREIADAARRAKECGSYLGLLDEPAEPKEGD